VGARLPGEGDEIVHHRDGAPLEHRAVAAGREATGATLRYIGLTDDGTLDLLEPRRAARTTDQILGVTAMSNALGTITPCGS
jgi:cysteine desulfurase/selenocysteine lyase